MFLKKFRNISQQMLRARANRETFASALCFRNNVSSFAGAFKDARKREDTQERELSPLFPRVTDFALARAGLNHSRPV